jgi:DNA-binding ferritin-like protein
MHHHTGLAEEQRQGIVNLLTVLLADEYVLYTKTRNYHWNVGGHNSMTCISSLRSSITR